MPDLVSQILSPLLTLFTAVIALWMGAKNRNGVFDVHAPEVDFLTTLKPTVFLRGRLPAHADG